MIKVVPAFTLHWFPHSLMPRWSMVTLSFHVSSGDIWVPIFLRQCYRILQIHNDIYMGDRNRLETSTWVLLHSKKKRSKNWAENRTSWKLFILAEDMLTEQESSLDHSNKKTYNLCFVVRTRGKLEILKKFRTLSVRPSDACFWEIFAFCDRKDHRFRST